MVGSLPRRPDILGLWPYGKQGIRAVCENDVFLDSDRSYLPDLTDGPDPANVEVGIVCFDHDLMRHLA